MSEEIKKTEMSEMSEQDLDQVAGGAAKPVIKYKCPGDCCSCAACRKLYTPSKPNLA